MISAIIWWKNELSLFWLENNLLRKRPRLPNVACKFLMRMKTLTVSATLDSLKKIREFVMAAAKAAGLDRKTAYRLRLGVDEIATNTIEHGYVGVTYEKILHVYADIGEQTLKIILEDRGKPYDPYQALPFADLEIPLEDRQTGGLGIYLTLKTVDEFFYERLGERNRTILIMKR